MKCSLKFVFANDEQGSTTHDNKKNRVLKPNKLTEFVCFNYPQKEGEKK